MRAVFLFAVVAVVGVAEPVLGQPAAALPPDQVSAEPSPFEGRWTANVARSKPDPNHQFQSATLEFAVVGDQVTLTRGGINASGHEESGVTILQADGEKHPHPGVPGVAMVVRWIGPRVLDTVAMKAGQTVGHGVYEVSADGQTLTATVSGTDASGTDFEQVIVFDRVRS